MISLGFNGNNFSITINGNDVNIRDGQVSEETRAKIDELLSKFDLMNGTPCASVEIVKGLKQISKEIQ